MYTPNEAITSTNTEAPPQYSTLAMMHVDPHRSTPQISSLDEEASDPQLNHQLSSLTQWIPPPSTIQNPHLSSQLSVSLILLLLRLPQFSSPTFPGPCLIHQLTIQKPIVIPRVDIARKLSPPLPFMRLYSPALATHDIDAYTFMAFIDNLIVAQMPPAPLRMLGVAGSVVGAM
jgi:hypothetical protein